MPGNFQCTLKQLPPLWPDRSCCLGQLDLVNQALKKKKMRKTVLPTKLNSKVQTEREAPVAVQTEKEHFFGERTIAS
eukprot:m.147800 g.147800  ORF g.147800 m.147800 type:complete len:77 (+) comp24364_c1_seq3:105-335(+)